MRKIIADNSNRWESTATAPDGEAEAGVALQITQTGGGLYPLGFKQVVACGVEGGLEMKKSIA